MTKADATIHQSDRRLIILQYLAVSETVTIHRTIYSTLSPIFAMQTGYSYSVIFQYPPDYTLCDICQNYERNRSTLKLYFYLVFN